MLEQDRDTGSRVTIQTWKKAKVLSSTPTKVEATIGRANEEKSTCNYDVKSTNSKIKPQTKLDSNEIDNSCITFRNFYKTSLLSTLFFHLFKICQRGKLHIVRIAGKLVESLNSSRKVNWLLSAVLLKISSHLLSRHTLASTNSKMISLTGSFHDM